MRCQGGLSAMDQQQNLPTGQRDSPTKRTGRSYPYPAMSYWLEKIKAGDIVRLWKRLGGYAKDARHHITLERWVNGTISRAGYQVDVTAYTTEDGFVLRFTARDMSKLNGGSNEGR